MLASGGRVSNASLPVAPPALKTRSGVALIRTPPPLAEEKGAFLLKGEERRCPTVMKF